MSVNIRRGTRLRLALAAAVAVSGLVPLAAGAAGRTTSDPSLCPSPDKCYSLEISAISGALQPGSTVVYEGLLSNLSRDVTGFTLGASDIFMPSVFRDVAVQPLAAPKSASVAGNTIRLRNLSMAPGDTLTFRFSAVARRGGTYTIESDATQANNHLGVGNNLSQAPPKPTITISDTCGGAGTPIQAKCLMVNKLDGIVVDTVPVNGAQLKSRLVIPPVTVVVGDPEFLLSFRTDKGTPECPVVAGLPCSGTVWIETVIPVEYDLAHGWRMLFDGRGLTNALPVPVFLALHEETGVQEPILPETPLGPIASPLSGSFVNFTDNGDGTYWFNHITAIDDYKVMSLPVPLTE